LGWTVEVDSNAEKQLGKINRSDALRIRDFLRERLVGTDDPRRIGKALVGSSSGIFGGIGLEITGLSAVFTITGSSFSSSKSDIVVKFTDNPLVAI
jgi:hypothetical protein